MDTELTEEDKARIADARWREDTEDFHNAIAGRETGRQMRFGGQTRDTESSELKKSERAFRDALDRLLQDPEYRMLYGQLGETLSAAEHGADQTIADIQIGEDLPPRDDVTRKHAARPDHRHHTRGHRPDQGRKADPFRQASP